MTYRAPEQLPVGAAQHLAVGISLDSEQAPCVKALDPGSNPPTYFDAEW